MVSCKRVSELVSESLDRPLTWRERLAVRIHLVICRMCRRYREQITFVTRAARQMLRHPTGSEEFRGELSEEARQRLREAIEKFSKE